MANTCSRTKLLVMMIQISSLPMSWQHSLTFKLISEYNDDERCPGTKILKCLLNWVSKWRDLPLSLEVKLKDEGIFSRVWI